MSSSQYQQEIPKYCNLCQKGPFSGSKSAQEHFESAQHLAAESTNKHATQLSNNSNFYCKICTEQCNGPKSFMEHMASPRHKAKQEKSQQFQTFVDPSKTPERPYDFDGKRGYCHLCKLDLNSPQHVSDHLNGEKHRKKMEQFQNASSANLNCNACHMTFQNESSAELHFKNVHQNYRIEPKESLNLSLNQSASLMSYLMPQEHDRQLEEIDKLFHNFKVDLQNEPPPKSVLENMQRNLDSPKNPSKNCDEEYTFSISRGHCNVCDLELTSVPHKNQHLSGSKHQKSKQAWLAKRKGTCQSIAMNNMNSTQTISSPVGGSLLHEELEYIFEGNSGFCNVCTMKLNSIEHASEHLNSTLHRNAKDDWLKADHSIALNQKDEEDSIKPHPFLQTSQQCSEYYKEPSVISQAPPLVPKPTYDKPEYTFDGNKGYCNICKLELTSKQHADQHLSGARHQKSKETVNVPIPKGRYGDEYTFDGNRGICHICNLDLTSKQHANQHLSGAKHQKAKNALGGLTLEPKPTHRAIPEGSSTSEDKAREKAREEFTFNGSRGKCNVCNIELTSKSHAETHLNGKPHSKAKQRWLQGITDNTPLFCEICHVPCSGPESMQQHLDSKKHRDRLEVMAEKTGTGPPILMPVSSSDNTKWFHCEICNCRVNSQQQLDVHKMSPKHKALEEKRMSNERVVVKTRQYDMGNNQPFKEPAINFAYSQTKDFVGRAMPGENNNWNTNPSQSQYHQPNQFNLLQDTIPSYVKPLPNVVDRPPLQNTSDPSTIRLPAATVLTPKQSSTVNASVVPSLSSTVNRDVNPIDIVENYSLPSFHPFHMSLGPALTLGSLREHDPSMKIADRSIFEMARPKVFQTDSIDSDIAVQAGVNGYRNLDFEQTQLKSKSLSVVDHSSFIQDRNDVNITSSSPEKQDITKSLAFKSLNEEVHSKLQYNHRGYPDGDDSDEDTKDSACSSNFQKIENKREFIVPEVTTDILPRFGETHFVVTDPPSSNSFFESSSSSRRSSGTDTARAIKNRSNSKQSQNSLINSADTSLESFPEVFTENNECRSSDKIQNDMESPETSICISTYNTIPHVEGMSGRNADRSSPYPYKCDVCNRPMNTEKAYKDHLRGKGHLDRVAVQPAPDREHPFPVKSINDFGRIGFDLTHTKPRSYQIELFNKSMEKDRVCFLPTGTGKTLISCMTVSAMLKQNPTRQVMFLVDKVLLVLQQSRYIIKEIGNREYDRFSHDDPSMVVKRRPVIAALCGGSQNTGGMPLWKHDVIVVTAAYYMNLLLKKILRWNDNCLVVFDEAHHCIKNHPFNKLLHEYHRKCPENIRPKLLGLTASPAGRATVQETIMMLHQLMDNLGGASIALVEENTFELKKFQSNATMETHFISMTPKEKMFKEELQVYLLNCYTRLCEETDLLQRFDLGLTSKKSLTDKELLECAKEVDGNLLNSLEITINMANPKEDSKADKKIFSRNLIKHTQFICITLNVLIESGVHMAVEELQELMAIDPSTNFEFARMNGLPCARMEDALHTCMNVEGPHMSLLSQEMELSPHLSKLVEIVTRPEYVNWSSREAMVLVLVKQRETAFKMKNMLQSHDAIRKLQLNIEAVVGHGTTSGTEQGMTVARQKKVLEDMKKRLCHIVVATSVAEEGVDIPECELVITFNPPSTVTALVQMRGRARKSNSKFIILCNDSKEKEELDDLMKKEENMIKAAEIIIKEQKTKK